MGKSPDNSSKKRYVMTKRFMKNAQYFKSSKKCQLKLQYHLMFVWIAVLKNMFVKSWQGGKEKESLVYYWQECKLAQFGKQYRGPSKPTNRTTILSSSSASGYTAKGIEVGVLKSYFLSLNFHW